MNILIKEEERFMCLFVSVLSAFCARFREAIVRCVTVRSHHGTVQEQTHHVGTTAH